MRINSIRLQNFKCFEDKRFDLASQFNLVVGDNGKGKSALLDGLNAGLGAFFNFIPGGNNFGILDPYVRRNLYVLGQTPNLEPQLPCHVACEGSINNEIIKWGAECISISPWEETSHCDSLDEITKRLNASVMRGDAVVLPIIQFFSTERFQREDPLELTKTLLPDSRFHGYDNCQAGVAYEDKMMSWFKTHEIAAIQRNEKIGVLEAARKAIVNCLEGAKSVRFDVQYDELMLELDNGLFPFSFLSDGYRNMLAMVADIAIRAATFNPQLLDEAAEETPGVVLIDEIDLHLHPKWQRRVVEDLMRTFPKIQFIATTHSPFIIQSLKPSEEVRLINLDNESAADYANKSIEDITEEIQDVEMPQQSKRFHDMMKAAEEYYRVLQEAKGASGEQLAALKAKLDGLTLPYSDDPAYQAFLRMERLAAKIDGEGNDATH